ncbi:hypothetical protein PENSUB_9039 [Penicillium subrubescens]|uniref:FCP1 homology domain-containing protein n=2 Tax=Penicillium subrubescens TaxID=1316194 RepID=A0A1Q5TEE3_9EURO|nr:hypothetical protein PENSUB_9039 [Penicillium subrubescens]
MGDSHNGQEGILSCLAQGSVLNGSTNTKSLPQDSSSDTVYQSIEDPTAQGGSTVPIGPGSIANNPDSFASIFNNPANGNGGGGEQFPNGNIPVSPSNAFGAFNPLWNPVNMNSSSMATQQLQSPLFPFFNPMFFNQNAMGNMPGFPMMPPFNPMFPMQSQNMSTMAGPTGQIPTGQIPNTGPPKRVRSPTPPMKRPSPTKEYMLQASKQPQRSPSKRPLLIILDLNGTLIFRKHRKLPPVFARRHGLDEFLDILTSKYAVMIWTSSKPPTLNAVCDKLFPVEKRNRMIALWGRDKFGLTPRQYNAKLQVYKELRKVWSSPEIQAAYPGSQAVKPAAPPKRAGGKHSKKNQMRQQAGTFPPGQRWDQTNTILIDDSKLKALSEPFNILEIPEFTNDPSIDESSLFTQVLAKLDALSRYDDVSKVLRQWNECVISGEANILDLEIKKPDESSDSEEDGGMSLAPATDPGTSANPIDLDTDVDADSRKTELDCTEAARRRTERRKIRKKAKQAKKAEKAADAVAQKEQNKAQNKNQPKNQPKAQASGNKNANTPKTPQAANPAKMSRRKKGKNKPAHAQEPDVERELEPNAPANIIENIDGQRYSFHPKVQSEPAPRANALEKDEEPEYEPQFNAAVFPDSVVVEEEEPDYEPPEFISDDKHEGHQGPAQHEGDRGQPIHQGYRAQRRASYGQCIPSAYRGNVIPREDRTSEHNFGLYPSRTTYEPQYVVEPSPAAQVLDRAWEEYHRGPSGEWAQGPIPQLQQHSRPYFGNRDPRSVSPVTDDGKRAVSPVPSNNSLLDKLEEGLGFPKKD